MESRSEPGGRPPGDLPTGKVIVAGCVAGGLAAIRSLAARHIHVVAMTYNGSEPGLRSRYVDEVAICPHPRDEQAFIEYLLANAVRWRGALILETNDHYASALARHKRVLSEHYRLVVPEWSAARTFIEKDRTYALADRCGVARPGTFSPGTLAELEEILDEVTLPVLVKPVRSHEFVAVFRQKLFQVDTADELRSLFARTVEAGIPVMVTELIPGTDYRTLEKVWTYVDSTGDLTVELYNTKLRQTPPMFGLGRVTVTTPVFDDVRDASMRMLTESGHHGIGNFEFKRDPRDGQIKLIEVNIRLMASAQLAVAAGVDLPWIIYQDLVHGRQVAPKSYIEGVHYVDLLADITDYLTKEDNRLRNSRSFLEPYRARRRTYAYLSLKDPLPFLSEATGKATRRIGRWRQRRGLR